jgi:sulfur-oxidizing protein SoxA
MTVRILILTAFLLAACVATASPPEDLEAFRAFFEKRLPDVEFAEYANGIYAIDEDARRQWMEIEEFPPYEFGIEQGQSLWETAFANGSGYAQCYGSESAAIRQLFPRFDKEHGQVITLEMSVNLCRLENAEQPLAYGSEDMVALTAYIAFESRGKTIDIFVPEDNPAAIAAYEDGKRFYYSKRGQLNISCADCHVQSVGQWVRADHLSSSLGHPTHFPVYRSKLGKLISLHQRFYGCVRDVRAKPFDLQSEEFRNLEYFLTYMSNGLEVNGPGARK